MSWYFSRFECRQLCFGCFQAALQGIVLYKGVVHCGCLLVSVVFTVVAEDCCQFLVMFLQHTDRLVLRLDDLLLFSTWAFRMAIMSS